MAIQQDIVQLPYRISDAMPREQLILAVDRNLKEIERMLSILQQYMKQTGKPIIEDAEQVITHDEEGNAVIDPNKLADKMVGLNHALQIAEKAVGSLNLALDAVLPEHLSAAAIKAAQPQWATHALNKDYAVINNSPLKGYIAWQNVKITYKGEEYSVIDGNTNMRYIWWDYNYPTVMQTTDNFPELTDDDVLVFFNKFGAHLTVPGATVLDGGLIVPGTITADALAAACVLAKHIGVGEIIAVHIKAGEITTEHISADGLSFNVMHGGTATLGGYDNINGLLSILNEQGIEVVRADKNGITINAGSVGGNDVADLETQAGAQAKVDAEEQARIDDANANLAEAKAHAEAKAAEAEQAAKAHSDAQLSDHDANQSPHSLPSYVKMQGDGFKVFDGSNRLRAHLGQYLAGLFGLALYNIYGDRVFEADDDGNLKIVGDFITYAGGQKALEMVGQILKVYDWEGTERVAPVGQLYSSRRNHDPAKPGVVLANKKNARLSLDYEEGDTFYAYVTFDKDNTTGQEEPIKFFENIYIESGARLRLGNYHLTEGTNTSILLRNQSGTHFLDFGLNIAGDGFDAYHLRGSYFRGKVYCYSDFDVRGAKNALHQTEHYGERQISAYETAEYYFGDIGSGTINQDGECIVYIDDIFSECINTDIEYHVFTQTYSGQIASIDRQPSFFVVYGEPETEFSWELKAKRRGYEYHRLEVPNNEQSVDVANFDDCVCDNEVVVDMLEKEITYNLTDYLLS